MRIYERSGSPYWWYEFTAAGVRHRGSTKRLLNDKEAAQEYMVYEYRRLMDQRQLGRKPETTLEEAFDRVLKTVSGNTYRQYEWAKRKWLGIAMKGKESHWGLAPDTLLSEITQSDLDEHRQNRVEEGLKGNSINAEIRIMIRVMSYNAKRFAVRQDLDFEKVEGFTKTRFLTEDEVGEVGEFLSRPTDGYAKAKDFFDFLTGTGARLGEGLNARWPDLNLKDRTFEVYRIKTKSLSLVPLPEHVVTMLSRRKNQKAPFEEMTRAIRLIRIALDECCNQNERVNMQRGRATVHSLRDTYASRMVRGGMTLHELAKLLGHTSAAMSAKYGHLESGDVIVKARKVLG